MKTRKFFGFIWEYRPSKIFYRIFLQPQPIVFTFSLLPTNGVSLEVERLAKLEKAGPKI
jgi:hypothetical protein